LPSRASAVVWNVEHHGQQIMSASQCLRGKAAHAAEEG
jgi:hypothetical protein